MSYADGLIEGSNVTSTVTGGHPPYTYSWEKLSRQANGTVDPGGWSEFSTSETPSTAEFTAAGLNDGPTGTGTDFRQNTIDNGNYGTGYTIYSASPGGDRVNEAKIITGWVRRTVTDVDGRKGYIPASSDVSMAYVGFSGNAYTQTVNFWNDMGTTFTGGDGGTWSIWGINGTYSMDMSANSNADATYQRTVDYQVGQLIYCSDVFHSDYYGCIVRRRPAAPNLPTAPFGSGSTNTATMILGSGGLPFQFANEWVGNAQGDPRGTLTIVRNWDGPCGNWGGGHPTPGENASISNGQMNWTPFSYNGSIGYSPSAGIMAEFQDDLGGGVYLVSTTEANNLSIIDRAYWAGAGFSRVPTAGIAGYAGLDITVNHPPSGDFATNFWDGLFTYTGNVGYMNFTCAPPWDMDGDSCVGEMGGFDSGGGNMYQFNVSGWQYEIWDVTKTNILASSVITAQSGVASTNIAIAAGTYWGATSVFIPDNAGGWTQIREYSAATKTVT